MKKSTYITLFIVAIINWFFMAMVVTGSSGASLWRLVSNALLVFVILYPLAKYAKKKKEEKNITEITNKEERRKSIIFFLLPTGSSKEIALSGFLLFVLPTVVLVFIEIFVVVGSVIEVVLSGIQVYGIILLLFVAPIKAIKHRKRNLTESENKTPS